jgi:PAS domain-containing protein
MDERATDQNHTRSTGNLAAPGERLAAEPGKNGGALPHANQEARYRDLIDQSPFSIIIYTLDGRPIYANPASFALWKLTPESWEHLKVGYNVLEDPVLESYGLKPCVEAGFAGEPTVLPAVFYDLRQASQGTAVEPVAENLWVSGYIYPLKDPNGEITEVVVVHEDVTDQKRAEEELRQSEERFRELAENINEVFWLFDWVEQKVLYFSPAYEKIWGRPSDDVGD